MISKSTVLHLRFPFSYFLLPVYLFAVALSPNLSEPRLGWVFFIVHFLLYPASNGYNSYFDKDESSIGGLKNPPPVEKGLYWTSLLLDAVAIILGFMKISPLFALMLLCYGLASKAYSHPISRLKKRPVAGWLITGFFQGFFTFMMCYAGINRFDLLNLARASVIWPAMLTSLVFLANYPLTQVYQHDEDKRHGDLTLSRLLGVQGTFLFTGTFFLLAGAGFVWYFNAFQELSYAWVFLESLVPVLLYFLYWFYQVRKDGSNANYTHAMRMNFISATSLSAFFIWLFFSISHVGEYLF